MSSTLRSTTSAMSSSNHRQSHTKAQRHQHAAPVGPVRQHHVNPNGSMAVYAPGFKFVLNLPKDAIVHLPPASLNVTRLVLCSNYDARDPKGSCSMGERCKFVHADTGRAIEHNIHVNYAWRSIDEVTYERFPAGTDFHVAPPNTKLPADVMDSGLVLKTKGLESTRRPLSHCAHYYFNRTCNLGSECHFIHAVFIDPTAKQHQRAPVPSQLGEGRELQMSKRQKEAHDEAIARLAHVSNAAPHHHHQREQPQYHHLMPQQPSVHGMFKAPALTAPFHLDGAAVLQTAKSVPQLDSLHGLLQNSSSGFDVSVGSGSSPSSSVNSARGTRSIGSSGSVARYRHHPYDLTASRIVTVSCHC